MPGNRSADDPLDPLHPRNVISAAVKREGFRLRDSEAASKDTLTVKYLFERVVDEQRVATQGNEIARWPACEAEWQNLRLSELGTVSAESEHRLCSVHRQPDTSGGVRITELATAPIAAAVSGQLVNVQDLAQPTHTGLPELLFSLKAHCSAEGEELSTSVSEEQLTSVMVMSGEVVHILEPANSLVRIEVHRTTGLPPKSVELSPGVQLYVLLAPFASSESTFKWPGVLLDVTASREEQVASATFVALEEKDFQFVGLATRTSRPCTPTSVLGPLRPWQLRAMAAASTPRCHLVTGHSGLACPEKQLTIRSQVGGPYRHRTLCKRPTQFTEVVKTASLTKASATIEYIEVEKLPLWVKAKTLVGPPPAVLWKALRGQQKTADAEELCFSDLVDTVRALLLAVGFAVEMQKCTHIGATAARRRKDAPEVTVGMRASRVAKRTKELSGYTLINENPSAKAPATYTYMAKQYVNHAASIKVISAEHRALLRALCTMAPVPDNIPQHVREFSGRLLDTAIIRLPRLQTTLKTLFHGNIVAAEPGMPGVGVYMNVGLDPDALIAGAEEEPQHWRVACCCSICTEAQEVNEITYGAYGCGLFSTRHDGCVQSRQYAQLGDMFILDLAVVRPARDLSWVHKPARTVHLGPYDFAAAFPKDTHLPSVWPPPDPDAVHVLTTPHEDAVAASASAVDKLLRDNDVPAFDKSELHNTPPWMLLAPAALCACIERREIRACFGSALAGGGVRRVLANVGFPAAAQLYADALDLMPPGEEYPVGWLRAPPAFRAVVRCIELGEMHHAGTTCVPLHSRKRKAVQAGA